MLGEGSDNRELITPLLSTSSQPAGSHQQVMSPTLDYGTAGHGTSVSSVTPNPPIAGTEDGLGFASGLATGRAFASTGQSGTAEPEGVHQQVSTTSEGGIVGTHGVQMPGQTPGGSPGLEASTGMSGTATGEALPGGRVVAGDSTGEGFVTPRSQQGLPTIAEMVEGFPVSGRQLMTRVGDFFRVARTEVMQVPVWQDSHVTPPRSTTRSTGSPDGALGNLALGDGSLGSHGSSPPQVGSHGTPASFAPPPPGREGSLLSADVLQRMHALEQRAPHLYGQPFDRPQSRSNSSSLPQEAIQAEVARQLAGFDQRAQVQELEIQRLRRQLEEERVMREQAMREAALARNAPQVANPAPQQNPIPTQVAPPQEVQVPPQVTHQVQDVASQAVEAFRAPAQSAASAGRGLLSSLWSGIGGLQEGFVRSTTPPGRDGHQPQPLGPLYGSTVPPTPQVPRPQVHQAPQASGSGAQESSTSGGATTSALPGGTAAPNLGNPVLDALVLGMQQLQTLQANQLNTPKKEDAPESVKTGITALPKLAPPDHSGGSLDFQDWLQQISGLMSDFSDSSQVWWSAVVQVSKDAYDRWVTASPIERLQVEPDDRTELTEGKWGRVNARACSMLLEALDPAVKSDIIARKANQAAPKILFRLYTTYQPGGTGERNLVLTNLQNPSAVHDATSGVSALRAWGRWYQRCVDFGMNLPDPMVLVGALTAMTKPVISKDVEVTRRTEMVKSALQLHARPSEEAVRSYHKHLLAEFETLAGASKPKKGDVPKVQAFDASGGSGGNGNPSGGAGAKGGGKGKTCKYFLSPKGCKYGAACRSPHSMSELSKAERFKKCLNCGSEEHRAADCKATRRKDLTQQEPKSKPQVAQVSPPASSALPIVPATPLMSMDSFIQQATQALRQIEASHAAAGVPPPAIAQVAAPITPTPEGGGQHQPTPSSSPPSIKRLAITSIMPASCYPPSHLESETQVEPDLEVPLAYALLDSGATHPMRQAKDEHEWDAACEVQVALAGDNTTSMRLTTSGTLLLPPGRDGLVQPIVPMGAIIQQLGYKLVWSAGSCKLYPPDGRSIRLRVKNGCPEVVESQALTLMSRLEEHKLNQADELRRRAEEGKDRIRQAKLTMDKTWWDHTMDYVTSGDLATGNMAISTAPFFQDVPDRALSGILTPGGVEREPFWDALRAALPHLNRRRRKALHDSKNWVVHLFAGSKPHQPLLKLESNGTVVLELDIERSQAQNLYNDALWSLLIRAAREGRIAAVIGGPPCRTMSVLRHRPGGPRPVRSPQHPFGLPTLNSDERKLVDHDTGLFARMLWLHALATAGRRVNPSIPRVSSLVAFLLEQPQEVARYMAPENRLVGEVPSWWSNPMWLSYADEAGLFEVDFNQGPLGHVSDKPTTVGTNLPDLRDLQGLKGETKGPWKGDSKQLAAWAPGLVDAIALALRKWPQYRVYRVTQADWERHVANNHIPYRRDCAVCVHGAGVGRRHAGVAHPDAYCMSADVAGPIRTPGRDPESRNHKPATFKYFLSVSYRFPRLKGVKEESDPAKTEGFDDPALLPGGTDDLADNPSESRPPEGDPGAEEREDYQDPLYSPSGSEVEEEQEEEEEEDGKRVRAAKVKEEYP